MLVYDLTSANTIMSRRYVGFRNTPRPTSAPQVIEHPGSALNLRSDDVALQHELKSSRLASCRSDSDIELARGWVLRIEIERPRDPAEFAVVIRESKVRNAEVNPNICG
jgi:hypothetical protein